MYLLGCPPSAGEMGALSKQPINGSESQENGISTKPKNSKNFIYFPT